MKKSSLSWVLASCVCALVLLLGEAFAQQSLETNFRISGMGVLSAFEKQREVIQKCSAVFYDGREEIAYGVVVSVDGFILTKASEIQGVEGLKVRIDRDSYESVEVVSIDPAWDVALVKVDAAGVVPADFAESSDLVQGTWVVVNGASSRSKRRILAGIISASAREIEPDGGAVLGVQLEERDGMILVKEVSEKSGAEEAGMMAGDQILSIEEEELKAVGELLEFLEDQKAGRFVALRVIRDGVEVELEVRLSARDQVFEAPDRNDMMSGDFSKRRSGFPRVIQHDILGNAATMGGPVLTLDGKTVGMNIARANRAETFAIPVEELRLLAERMISAADR